MMTQWLESFKRAEQGDEKLQRVLSRYERMIATKREKEAWKRRILEAFVRTCPCVSSSLSTHI